MKINVFTNNILQLQGRVANVKEYAAHKAASITVAVDNGKDKAGNPREAHFISIKSFAPAIYNRLKVGMMVRVYGHVSPNKYEKNGETVYDTDLVADYIDFLESKAIVDAREESRNKTVA